MSINSTSGLGYDKVEPPPLMHAGMKVTGMGFKLTTALYV